MDKKVEYIIDELNKNGFEAFIVGGCVRDLILKRTPKDYDITTSALPEEIKKIFNKTFDTGILHGTVTVVIEKENFEVTTYRIDGTYSDNRHPDEVVFTKNLEEDLLRRDFTMNAIAFHKKIGFIDPYDGIEDIKNRIIKGVGNPDRRFKEDGLRMLRAVRFSAQLDFEIEKTTYNSIILNQLLIKNISIERIRDEILKILLSENVEKILFLIDTGLLKNINLDVNNYLNLNKEIIIKTLDKSDNDQLTRLLLFFQLYNTLEIESVLKFFKFDNKTINESKLILKKLNNKIKNDYYFISKIINEIGINNFKKLLSLQKIIFLQKNDDEYIEILDNIVNNFNLIENNPFFIKDLNFNGNDLINLGITDGKIIGKILNELLELVLKNPNINNFEDLKTIVRKKMNNN